MDGGSTIYDDDEFLKAIRAEGGLAGTGEIAAEVGCAHDTAYKRLVELREVGVVSSQKVGTTLAWSIVDD